MLKKIIKIKTLLGVLVTLAALAFSCEKSNTNRSDQVKNQKGTKKLSKKFKTYWYSGQAEITSYELEQVRYGELRSGEAVLIYVTEDFLPIKQVKADYKNPDNINILKLNTTKKFNTGVYPYSIMQSVFYPISNKSHALKVSSTIQEWCGHVYSQLNNRQEFDITSHSYFENEADKRFQIPKAILENELWVQLRINPQSLPVGEFDIIPSFEYTQLNHIALKTYKATGVLKESSYRLHYPEINRTLHIQFKPEFPHTILAWEETFQSDVEDSPIRLSSRAKLLKTIKIPYWKNNRNDDVHLRDTLQLK